MISCRPSSKVRLMVNTSTIFAGVLFYYLFILPNDPDFWGWAFLIAFPLGLFSSMALNTHKTVVNIDYIEKYIF
jgi:hypothetical protein